MKETTSYGSSIVAKITDNLAASIVIACSVALAVAVGVAAGPAQINLVGIAILLFLSLN